MRAGAPFGAPFSHLCAVVARLTIFMLFYRNLQNFDKNSVLIFCFAISCVPQVVKIRKFPVSDSGPCIRAKKNGKKFVDHMFVFYTFSSVSYGYTSGSW